MTSRKAVSRRLAILDESQLEKTFMEPTRAQAMHHAVNHAQSFYISHRLTTLTMRERVTSLYFETVVTPIQLIEENVFSKTRFINSQINKVYSPTIFCVVLSDLMGFWEAFFFR